MEQNPLEFWFLGWARFGLRDDVVRLIEGFDYFLELISVWGLFGCS